MNLFFADPMYDRQATATLAYAYYGGADLGECLTTTRRIQEGDAEGWYREWTATADRVFDLAEKSAAAGRRVSAREAYCAPATTTAPPTRSCSAPRWIRGWSKVSTGRSGRS